MARISYVEKDGAPPEVAETFAKMEARGNYVGNLWKMIAHSSSALIHVIRTGNALLTKTRINPKLREMAILRTAELLGCAYEIRPHTKAALQEGMTDKQLKAIKGWESSNSFSDIERAVLRFTDEVAQVAKVKDETFSNLAKYLDEGMMAELALIVGFYGMLARTLLPFEVDLD